MPKFRVEYSRPELQLNALLRRVKENTETQIRQAARAFLREMIQKIPVLTGEARGTLLPLGKFLRVAVPINAYKERSDKNQSTGENDHPFLFEFGHEGAFFYFQLEPQLFHFWWNEFQNHPEYKNAQLPTPWDSYDAGKSAFFDYLESTFLFRVEELKNFIVLDKSFSSGRFG